jgi:hypothetical protein
MVPEDSLSGVAHPSACYLHPIHEDPRSIIRIETSIIRGKRGKKGENGRETGRERRERERKKGRAAYQSVSNLHPTHEDPRFIIRTEKRDKDIVREGSEGERGEKGVCR